MIARLVYRLLAGVTNSDSMWELLNHTGITVFVGPNGSGKSFAAVASELPAMAGIEWRCNDSEHRHHAPFRRHAAGCEECSGPGVLDGKRYAMAPGCPEGLDLFDAGRSGTRKIYSTVVLTNPDGTPHPLFVPLVDYQQLLTIEHADVVFDEVAGIADASESGTMPVQVVNWQHKLRKADVRQRVTTPAYSRCAKPIRQVAQVVVEARAHFPARSAGNLWRPRQMVTLAAYDATQFEDWTVGKRDKLAPLARAVLWVPEHPAGAAYNTLGQVLSLGHVTEHGMCAACGGTRSRPRCGCPTDLPEDLDAYRVVEELKGTSRVRRIELGTAPAPEAVAS